MSIKGTKTMHVGVVTDVTFGSGKLMLAVLCSDLQHAR